MFPNPWSPIQATADFCFGRDNLYTEVIQSAFQSRAALLLGGRQSGKTTLLLRIRKILTAKTASVHELNMLDIPVYVNLMSLQYDAGPSQVFRLLSQRAKEACNLQIEGFDLHELPSDTQHSESSVDSFAADIKALRDGAGEVYIRFLFLLDESKRILGDRFPRGFQDNIFALLYGDDLGIGNQVSMVFTGAQELYKFCEDDTSPIGSRASNHIITNLKSEDIQQMLQHIFHTENTLSIRELSEQIYEQTGGQAGLSAILSHSIAYNISHDQYGIDKVITELHRRYITLLRLWVNSLTDEAIAVQDLLHIHGRADISLIANTLHQKGLDRFKADRACDELLFTGIAKMDGNSLQAVNKIYWVYISLFLSEQTGSQIEREIWHLIEEVELGMRDLVRKKYEAKWPNAFEDRILKIIGSDRDKLERIRTNISKQYPYSEHENSIDIMQCLYLAQLGTLIVSNQAWEFFRDLFRDKRELEDMLADITPVRNDRAHFRAVPRKELERCRIACEDLLVILERANQGS